MDETTPAQPQWRHRRYPVPVPDPSAPADDEIDTPNCPGCLERMDLHPEFPVWWCDSCQLGLDPSGEPIGPGL